MNYLLCLLYTARHFFVLVMDVYVLSHTNAGNLRLETTECNRQNMDYLQTVYMYELKVA